MSKLIIIPIISTSIVELDAWNVFEPNEEEMKLDSKFWQRKAAAANDADYAMKMKKMATEHGAKIQWGSKLTAKLKPRPTHANHSLNHSQFYGSDSSL